MLAERLKRVKYPSVIVCLLPLLLMGCAGSEDTPTLPIKHWGDIEVSVETRPPKVKVGMVEFVVITATKGVKPSNELVVSLRMEGREKWHQAIQDGFLGVYRRVVNVRDPAKDVLAVKLRVKRTEDEKILYFPLAQQQTRAAAAQ